MTHRHRIFSLVLFLLTTLAFAAPDDQVPVPLKWAPIAGAGSYRVEVQTEGGKTLVTKDTVDPALALSLAPGNYKVRISSLNRFGKVDSASPWTPMTVRKLVAPAVKSVQPSEVEEGSGFTLRVTASAEEGVAFTLEGTKGTQAPTAVRHPKPDQWELDFGAVDPGAFDLRAVAPSGKTGGMTGALTVRPYPAVTLTPGDPVTLVEGETLTLTVGALGVDDQALWTLEGGPAPVMAATVARQADGRWALSFPALAPGTYTLRAVARTGKVGEAVAQVRVEPYPEVVLQPVAAETVEEEPFSLTVEAMGVDASTHWELTGAQTLAPTLVKPGQQPGQWVLSFASAPTVGTYGLKATTKGAKTATLASVLTTTRHPPVVTKVTPETIEADSFAQLTLEGSLLGGVAWWTLVRSGGTNGIGHTSYIDEGSPENRVVRFYRIDEGPGVYDLTATVDGNTVVVLSRALRVLHPDPVLTAVVTPPSDQSSGTLQLLVENRTDQTQVAAVLGDQTRDLTVVGAQGKVLTVAVPDDLAPGTYDLRLTTDEGKRAEQKAALVWPPAATGEGPGTVLQVEANLEGMAAKLDGGPQWNLPHRFKGLTPGNHVVHIVPAFDNPKLYTGAQNLAVDVQADQSLTVRALVDNQSVPVVFSGLPEGTVVDWGVGPREANGNPVFLPWGSYALSMVNSGFYSFQNAVLIPTGSVSHTISFQKEDTNSAGSVSDTTPTVPLSIPFRTIPMTGKVSDWEGIAPLLTCGSRELGLQDDVKVQGWMANDNLYFYYRISYEKSFDRWRQVHYGISLGDYDLIPIHDQEKTTWNFIPGGGSIVDLSDGFEVKVLLSELWKILGSSKRTQKAKISALVYSGTFFVVPGDNRTKGAPIYLEQENTPHPRYHYRLDSLAEFPGDQQNIPGITEVSEGTHRFLHLGGSFPNQGLKWKLPSNSASSPNSSVSFWLRPSAVRTQMNLLSFGSLEDEDLVTMGLDSDAQLYLSGKGFSLRTAVVPVTDRWMVVTMVQLGNGIRLYADGKLIGQGTYDRGLLMAGPQVSLGGGPGVAWGLLNLRNFQGNLDDLRIYDRALSEAEVKQLASPATLTASPVVKGPLAGLVTDLTPPKEGLRSPQGLAVGPDESVYVADTEANRVWFIPASTSNGLSLYSGTGSRGSLDTFVSAATFDQPSGLAIDPQGRMALSDRGGQLIRRIDTFSMLVSTLSGSGKAGFGDSDGTVQFNQPQGLAYDEVGNLFVADSRNHSIRRITPEGEVNTHAGTGKEGSREGYGPWAYGQDFATFKNPSGLALDEAGNLYVADTGNNKIRKIAAGPYGRVTTFAGTGSSGSTDGPGDKATFNQPTGLAIGPDGLLYVADTGNNLLRAIAPDGTVTTIAGSSKATSSFGASVKFDGITGLAFDRKGFLYISEKNAKRVRRME